MNIQRFTAPTTREAMAKARNSFGDSAVILSTRSTEGGIEVMAAAEESLAALTSPGAAAARSERAAPAVRARTGPAAPVASDSVQSDTEALAMSTLSFQEYVRERMLRKRRESGTGVADPAPETQPAATRRAGARVDQPAAPPQRGSAAALAASVPEPIRIRGSNASLGWEDAVPTPPMAAERTAQDARERSTAVELSALKDMIEERFTTLAWLGSSKQNPIQSNLMLKLIRAGYSPTMARAVLERVPTESGPAEAARWVMDVITRNLKTASATDGLCDQGGVVALVGATGVGKTTTAAKLAAQSVKQFGAGSVGLITLDTGRVSGYEQLRTHGRMLGVVAHLAHDSAALKDLLNLLSTKRMVVIDTAGLAQRDPRIQEMLDVLDLPKIKKCLVLNAGAHGDTLDDVLTGFKASALHGVVLSKVDEAVKLGPAIDALIRHQVVLRGVANGQRVPEDWQSPDAAALVRMSMGIQTQSAFDPISTDMGIYFSHSSPRGIDLGAGHV